MPGFLHNTCAVMRRETGRITRQPMYFVLMIVLPVVSFVCSLVVLAVFGQDRRVDRPTARPTEAAPAPRRPGRSATPARSARRTPRGLPAWRG